MIPDRLRDRPLDARGRVIPWMAPISDDGTVSFGKNQERLRRRAIEEHRCGQCGQPNDYWLWFIGDDVLPEVLEFFEPAMHEECARYAINVCPFLGHENYQVRGRSNAMYTVDSTTVIDGAPMAVLFNPYPMDDERPPRMSLIKTRNYKIVIKRGDLPIAQVKKPAAVEWF